MELGQLAGEGLCLGRVRREQDRHIEDAPYLGDIGDSGVGGPQRAIAQAAADAYHLYIGFIVGHVYLDLFQAPGGQKTGGAADEHVFSRQCHASGNRNRVLLRDAHFHKLVRVVLGELFQRHRTPGIGGNGVDIGMFISKGVQRPGKCLAAGALCLHTHIVKSS